MVKQSSMVIQLSLSLSFAFSAQAHPRPHLPRSHHRLPQTQHASLTWILRLPLSSTSPNIKEWTVTHRSQGQTFTGAFVFFEDFLAIGSDSASEVSTADASSDSSLSTDGYCGRLGML